jgi:hypothetical protein
MIQKKAAPRFYAQTDVSGQEQRDRIRAENDLSALREFVRQLYNGTHAIAEDIGRRLNEIEARLDALEGRLPPTMVERGIETGIVSGRQACVPINDPALREVGGG